MTCKGATVPAMTTCGRFSTGSGNGFVLKTVAFLLVAAMVLVDVIAVGPPSQPRFTYIRFKMATHTVKWIDPELGWTLNSLSPLTEYQIQWRRQQDSADSWTELQKQPTVTESSSSYGRNYTVSYNLDSLNIQVGTFYVARLRARNLQDWSEWSADAVFTAPSAYVSDVKHITSRRDANEVDQHGGHDGKVLNGSATGSGATQLRSGGALTAAMVLAAALMAATAAASFH